MLPEAEAMLTAKDRRSGRLADWPLALKTIVGLWAVYAMTVVVRALLGTDPLTIMLNRSLTVGIGFVLTLLLYLAIASLAGSAGMRRKVGVALVGSVVAAVLLTGSLMLAEGSMRKSKEEFRFQAREGMVVIVKGEKFRIERGAAEPVTITMPRLAELQQREKLRIAADNTVVWWFFFAAWCAIYLAAVSQSQTLALQRRAAAAERAAQAAQVRALRYQVNPHFLFNTLNSLSSLVMTGRPQEAESMILKLSTFFRTSLSLDPNADVTLEQEIELQRLYLDIEKVRFPRRLKVEIDVPAYLGAARLPALVLQPVVENAIKYGVSATKDKVTLRIGASEPLPGKLRIEVTNRGGTALKSPRHAQQNGTGVGLANVCQRLEARFGSAASCSFGALDEGGYQVTMTLPFTRQDG